MPGNGGMGGPGPGNQSMSNPQLSVVTTVWGGMGSGGIQSGPHSSYPGGGSMGPQAGGQTGQGNMVGGGSNCPPGYMKGAYGNNPNMAPYPQRYSIILAKLSY